VREERDGVLVHHYFLRKKMLIFERLEYQKNRDFMTQTASPSRQRFQKKIALTLKVFPNYPYPFPFTFRFHQSSQKRE